MIRPASEADARAVCSIYNHYVLNTCVTFEEAAVSETEMSARIRDTTASLPWLILEVGGEVLGYAYASRWKSRCAYRYSVESTVYLRPDVVGRGFGRQLYDQLIPPLRADGTHAILAGIALPNPPSERLHERLGFKKVAHFEQVGWKFNRWIDVGYWELILPSNT
jgi:phosphinothricin acetyltransferase